MNNPTTHCAWCGVKLPAFEPGHTGGTGVAELPMTGERICYDCADQWTREQMKGSTDFVAYLSQDGKRLTTWSGGTLADVKQERIVRAGGFTRGKLTHVQAVTPDGSRWYGKGSGRGMFLRIHRAKGGHAHA